MYRSNQCTLCLWTCIWFFTSCIYIHTVYILLICRTPFLYLHKNLHTLYRWILLQPISEVAYRFAHLIQVLWSVFLYVLITLFLKSSIAQFNLHFISQMALFYAPYFCSCIWVCELCTLAQNIWSFAWKFTQFRSKYQHQFA